MKDSSPSQPDERRPRVSNEELADLRANLGIPLSVAEISRLQDDLADSRARIEELSRALREIVDANTALYGPTVLGNDFTERFEGAINEAHRLLSTGSAGQEGK